MRPGHNPIETYKASKGGDGLRIQEDLSRFVQQGYESLTPADKELLKWVGVFFRKPTPGKFMMRIRTNEHGVEALRTEATFEMVLGTTRASTTTQELEHASGQ